MTENLIVEKFMQRIMSDYPEADKIYIDLKQFAEELRQYNIVVSVKEGEDSIKWSEDAAFFTNNPGEGDKNLDRRIKMRRLNVESMPDFQQSLACMSDYDKGRVDGKLELIAAQDGVYHAMDCYCIESLDPSHYERWLEVLNSLSLSREKARIFVEKMGYNEKPPIGG